MDIAEWLRGLGLGQYAPAFAENEVDWQILSKLTSDDLKEIGVIAIGHRRRLLEAIAALATPPIVSPIVAPTAVRGEAERRQLTVMFCDLVGSTGLSARFDPEDLRDIVGAYHRLVADTVARFAGFVAKYMGDGVLIYFGYPEAHEDDAERAIRAGLAVIDAVGRLDAPAPLSVRLGIASGLVVVGDLIGEGAAQERGVVGETPNLAARLQGLAEPGSLVISEATRRLIGELFEVEDFGPRQLAGFAAPQPAWRVRGEGRVASRFEALRSGATPMVGRDEELELLSRRWQQSKTGEGRVVLISGEPGIGKSRLSAALSETIAGDPHTRLRYFCSPHHQDSAFYPFISQLERAAGFGRDDKPDERLAKLDALLSLGAGDADDLTLIAELLSLPNAAAELNLSPQKKRERLFEALLRQLAVIAAQRPVLLLFEDAHWIDPTSRELLDLTLDRVRRLPILLVVTFRPELQHGWGGQPHVTLLALSRLGERDVAALVKGVAGNAPLGSEVVEEIVERTDGVPLFVEELTKAVLERSDQDNRVAAVLSASPSPALAVPSTLHASLIARLDRIGAAAKEVAQIGAVLGREFSYELIEPVAERDEAELRASFIRLTEAGLLFCRGILPHSSYLFKHALVQDAAYGTLLRVRRQELHVRVAAAIEANFADLVERQPELLAHHLTGAGENQRAVAQWLKAGRHAVSRSAHQEAISHFGKGLTALSLLPETTERHQQEIMLRLAMGPSLLITRGFSSASAVEAYGRAIELCEQVGDKQNLFPALWGLWLSNVGSGRFGRALQMSGRMLALSEGEGDVGLRLQAHHSAWATHFYRGEFAQSRQHSDQGRLLYEQEKHHSLASAFGGHDAGACARNFDSWSNWLLGYPERALVTGAQALALAESLAHPYTMMEAFTRAGFIRLLRREPREALSLIDSAVSIAAEWRLQMPHEPGILRGAAMVDLGEVAEGLNQIRLGVTAPGRARDTAYQRATLAHALYRIGDQAGALAEIGEAIAAAVEGGERWWEVELYRLKGVFLYQQDPDESQAWFDRALQVAHHQQAKSLELRAASSLARLWAEEGRRSEAHQLLAPVYDWFTEGFDTADLKEAKALLVELA